MVDKKIYGICDDGLNFKQVASQENVSDLESNLAKKQDKLVSGTNIKTIGGQSLLGNGNIDAGGVVTPDFQNLLYTYDTPQYETREYTATQDCFLFGSSISGLVLTDTNGQVVDLGKWENRYNNLGYSLPYLVRKGQKLSMYHHYNSYHVWIYGIKK